MVLGLASTFMNLMLHANYLGLFFLIAGESALLPIPSEIILPFAGYLVFAGKMSFFFAVFAAVLGQLFGSVLTYFIGYYGGRPLVLKYGKYFLLSKRHFEHVESWFAKHGAATVFLTRLLPVARTIISFPAGIAKMNFKKFLLYSTAGITLWTTFLIYIGFKLGDRWQSIIQTFDDFQYIVIAGLVIFLIWWVHKELKEQKQSIKQAEPRSAS
jgi:membrane protein DedA with SNARE-associated domain